MWLEFWAIRIAFGRNILRSHFFYGWFVRLSHVREIERFSVCSWTRSRQLARATQNKILKTTNDRLRVHHSSNYFTLNLCYAIDSDSNVKVASSSSFSNRSTLNQPQVIISTYNVCCLLPLSLPLSTSIIFSLYIGWCNNRVVLCNFLFDSKQKRKVVPLSRSKDDVIFSSSTLNRFTAQQINFCFFSLCVSTNSNLPILFLFLRAADAPEAVKRKIPVDADATDDVANDDVHPTPEKKSKLEEASKENGSAATEAEVVA